MRETILLKTMALLREKGFTVESFLHSHACFDLVAKRAGLALVLKVFNNIDALRPEHAAELRKIAALFNATVLIVGEKSKAFSLEKGVLYERHGLAALSLPTFQDLLEERFPSVRYFKGKSVVSLDKERLRERRKELGLTLQEVAEKIGSSVESVHRYEKGASASLGAAESLEDVLSTSLIERIDLFSGEGLGKAELKKIYSEEIPDSALEKVHSLGIDIALFRHSPFKAFSAPKESLLFGKGEKRPELQRKAVYLERTERVFKSKPVLLSKEAKYKHVDRIPVVSEEELSSISKFKDLMHLIMEREKSP